ncbi:hypothetical protein K504DRAFT_399710 [Pleomassaria siparia CBS 279.74]|uniref:Nucleoporin NSP1 n=1 Tax=Pleomassaria siparia CBS 279.74 TaxID=1314801 RepID=A0A6G1KN13_9PLEO|nr:hypothetical protein K504DRAFT_399710 [Pleomassaria siparia CBS 279.74]
MFSIGGANKDTSADANKTTQSQASPGLFGGANQAGVSGTQGAQGTPKPSLFSVGSTTPASTPASKPPTFGFGSTTSASQTPTTTTTAKPLSFGANTPASTAAPGSMFPSSGTAAGTPGGGFNLGPKAATSTPASSSAAVSTPTTATSGPGLSAGSGDPAASGAPSTSGTTSSLFSKPNVPKPTTSAQQPTATTTAGPSGTAAADATKTGLGSSTAGPAPSAQSRLKNKSMDEIITRWAADLSKYQKEFQSQAETVARWDRALVENSDKVKQLYSKTFQAERDAAEVERQLTLMEENQAELDSYLDRYEKEIDGMMKSHGVGGRSDSLRGPDQERERTYKLAEKLQDRLNELNKDLTEMIEEINNTSQTLSKTGKPDDPLTKVVRVLNSQLSQLQLIDSGAAQLQEKISKAQKESHRVGTNGWNGLGTDPSDDFYRSFRGGRSDRFGGVS